VHSASAKLICRFIHYACSGGLLYNVLVLLNDDRPAE
jgi:hypothetical protein